MSILAGLAAANAARKWLPYVIGAAGGVALSALLIGVPAYFMVTGARAGQAAAELERDTWRDRAGEQAAGLREARLSIANLNTQIEGLVSLWHKTREEAERITAETQARAKTIANLDRKLKELTDDPDADPADIAIYTLECLRRIEAGDPAAAGAC